MKGRNQPQRLVSESVRSNYILQRLPRMTAQELLDWIARYDNLAYGLLWLYAMAKTGPLPIIAGYVSFSGALDTSAVLASVLMGTLIGSQLRFLIGRRGSPWLYEKFPRLAPWLALGGAAVERYGAFLLPLYRYSKGTYSLVGLGAGASRLSWRRFTLMDSLGAVLWASAWVALGVAFAFAGKQFDPRWAAYAGLTLLLAGVLVTTLFGRYLKQTLAPHALDALRQAEERRRAATEGAIARVRAANS